MSHSFPFFLGDGQPRPDVSEQLPLPAVTPLHKPENYLPDDGLRDACNVALLLGQPLLLTGEPGTGKTRFAYNLALELGLEPPLSFQVKSTSTAQSLFYTYDTLQRFHDIQSGAKPETIQPGRYLSIQALGRAILDSLPAGKIPAELADLPHSSSSRRAVVLIDELDKAPRDFPNDLLNELENLSFSIPELGDVQVKAEANRRPVVVITSNSEKDLPDPFLRRCVYYNIPFPGPAKLQQIVSRQLHQWPCDSASMAEAIELFYRLRDPRSGLRKPPATAELLGWLVVLPHLLGDPQVFCKATGLRGKPELLQRSLSSLIKTKDDQASAEQVLLRWSEEAKP